MGRYHTGYGGMLNSNFSYWTNGHICALLYMVHVDDPVSTKANHLIPVCTRKPILRCYCMAVFKVVKNWLLSICLSGEADIVLAAVSVRLIWPRKNWKNSLLLMINWCHLIGICVVMLVKWSRFGKSWPWPLISWANIDGSADGWCSLALGHIQ